MLNYILNLSRPVKRMVSLLTDSVLIMLSFWGGYWVRLDTETPLTSAEHWLFLAAIIPLTLVVFIKAGLYRAVLRFVSFRVLWTVGLGVLFSTGFLVLFAFYGDIFLPRSVPVIYFSFALILVGGARLFFRMIYQQTKGSRTPVVIYGAGASGRQLHLSLNQGNEYFGVGYVDDDPKLTRTYIQGLEVFAPDELEDLVEKHEVKKVLLAMPSVGQHKRLSVLKKVEQLPCEVLSIPGMADLVRGSARIDELKEVSIDDLLGREPVEPVESLLKADLTGKSVMVTGAGGSIGSELCRQIVLHKPRCLVLFDITEFFLYQIEKELSRALRDADCECQLIPVLGSVLSGNLLRQVMSKYAVDTVYHAAAYKHVPLVEENEVEGVNNNVFGTLHCAEAAIECGVSSFVLISTDKAVRPANIMGASKRMAELTLRALSEKHDNIRFTIVRFGNVLGSSGSVVPLFRDQIKAGGPVTVTHEAVVRYFMTIPEASQLVIQAGAMGNGGDIFVLDMGSPVKILELAHRMINLSGLTVRSPDCPDGDIEVKITGLRPGEKMYEELWLGEGLSGTDHPRILISKEPVIQWADMAVILDELRQVCERLDREGIRSIFDFSAIGYIPVKTAASKGISSDLVTH